MKKRFLFSIIIFSLIKWSAVLPINVPCESENQLKEITVVRRECKDFKNFVGSNLFDGSRKVCFSPEDVNLLVVRREFEMMIPKELPEGLLNDTNISHILRYFYYGFWLLRRIEDCNSQRILEKAFYDTLGGFLRYYLVPVSKFSFYASKMELKTVRNVMMLYQKCRIFLNTNGNGWRPPMHNPLSEIRSVIIETIRTDDPGSFDEGDKCCSDLDLTTASNGMEIVDDNMIVALPKIELEDGDGYLSNIWLPFSRKRTYNLRSCKSAFILFKFYKSVIRCYRVKSLSQKCFDQKFRQWIVENLKMHLGDEQFYPGLGGLLNIYETVRIGSKTADTSDSNKNEEEEKFIPQIEANSMDADERTLDNGLKVYGDRNLDDWLKEYEEVDFNGIKQKRSHNLKYKKHMKMTKRKGNKRRKEVCVTPVPVLPKKPCTTYETPKVCTKSPSVLDPQTRTSFDSSSDIGSTTRTGTDSSSTDKDSTLRPDTDTGSSTEKGTSTNTNEHQSTSDKGATHDIGTSPNGSTTKDSTSENSSISNTDTSTQSTSSTTTDSTSEKNVILDAETAPSITTSSSTGKDTTSDTSTSTTSSSTTTISTSTSTTTVPTTSSVPVSVLPQSQSDNTTKFVINFILFIIMTLLFLLLLITLLIFCRKCCNRSRIENIKDYFEKLIEKSKRAPSPKVVSTTTVTQSAISSTKSETSGKEVTKEPGKKDDKKGMQIKSEKKNLNGDQKHKKVDQKAEKGDKKDAKKRGRKGKRKAEEEKQITKSDKKSNKEKSKEKKEKNKKPKSSSSSTSEKVEDIPRRVSDEKKCIRTNTKGRTRQKRRGRVVRQRSRSRSRSRSR